MTDERYYGQQGVTDISSHFNSLRFLIKQMLGRSRTAIPAKIIAVHGGGVGPPPTLDVQKAINQIDAVKTSKAHGTIYGIACARIQAGTSAVICDPKVGDFGHVIMSDRDISKFKRTSQISDPDSFRRNHPSDGVFHMNMQGGTPTNYILHKPGGGFTIHDQFGNIWDSSSSGITVTCTTFQVNGKIQATGEIVAKNASTNIHVTTHTHASGPPPDPGS